MKKIITIAALFLTFAVSAQVSSTNLDAAISNKVASKTISNAVVGHLIAQNSEGKVVLATGNEFETILGFTTNAPYVTPNKPLTATGKIDEFTGIAYGTINAGDYVCPCGEKPGSVKTCEAGQKPYAKALTAGSNGSSFAVKVLAENLRKK
jgi:hypothetical protein